MCNEFYLSPVFKSAIFISPPSVYRTVPNSHTSRWLAEHFYEITLSKSSWQTEFSIFFFLGAIPPDMLLLKILIFENWSAHVSEGMIPGGRVSPHPLDRKVQSENPDPLSRGVPSLPGLRWSIKNKIQKQRSSASFVVQRCWSVDTLCLFHTSPLPRHQTLNIHSGHHSFGRIGKNPGMVRGSVKG